MSIQRKILILTTFSFVLATVAEAGWVDLYQDVYFKHKLKRVEEVKPDHCYNVACYDLNKKISSAKWSGLSENGAMFEDGDAMIAFFTDSHCGFSKNEKVWPVKTQSEDDLYFPENFRLDGINDIVSSFMVLDTGTIHSYWVICESGDLHGNTTAIGASG